MPEDEWDAMALNYTSGTSGKPKGVVYHHRGAYLMAMGTIPDWGLPRHPRYLYIVPLFHCNGWGHAWMMAIVAGTIICCRKIVADNIFNLIKAHKVTHFGGARADRGARQTGRVHRFHARHARVLAAAATV